MTLRLIGYGLIVVALGIVLVVIYRNSPQSEQPLQYSPSQMLTALWEQYKETNLEAGTYRTLDKSRDNVTTSEGQSYTMLRAVWMGDKTTFDEEWKWTETNLARPNDHLFSWIWGEKSDGTYGVLTSENGQNSASDADANIALALTFAYARWQDPAYLTAARAIMTDIWNDESITIDNQTYVLADNLEKTSSGATSLIDPSYLSPAAYRIFAEVDPAHPWAQAVSGSYTAIDASESLAVGTTTSAGLPTDWIAINKTTGAFSAPTSSGTDTNFSYDALRVPWNLALDYAWFGDSRDLQSAKGMSVLGTLWSSHGQLVAGYTHSGSVITSDNYETPAMYGGAIGYFMLEDPTTAKKIYDTKISYLFTSDWSGWRQTLSYYDDNWAWFGIGLYNHLLPNLTAGLPASFFSTPSSQ